MFSSYRELKGVDEAGKALDNFTARLAKALGHPEGDLTVTVDWPVSLVLARKPVMT